jgi:hypothetical protein
VLGTWLTRKEGRTSPALFRSTVWL